MIKEVKMLEKGLKNGLLLNHFLFIMVLVVFNLVL